MDIAIGLIPSQTPACRESGQTFFGKEPEAVSRCRIINMPGTASSVERYVVQHSKSAIALRLSHMPGTADAVERYVVQLSKSAIALTTEPPHQRFILSC